MKKTCIILFFSVLFFSEWVLRAADEMVDLSASASYEFLPTNGVKGELNFDEKASVNKDFLLKDSPSDLSRDFAFVTKKSRVPYNDDPAIVIRLASESLIKKIYIQNRKDKTASSTTKPLTVWYSSDKKVWKRLFFSRDAMPEWNIDIPEGIRAEFLRIGLDGGGALALNKVRIYGTRD